VIVETSFGESSGDSAPFVRLLFGGGSWLEGLLTYIYNATGNKNCKKKNWG
jgi:hypothetical protein